LGAHVLNNVKRMRVPVICGEGAPWFASWHAEKRGTGVLHLGHVTAWRL
jgi:NADH:ubiquinone oxidoreductase subunit F (NADH-binding)